MLSRANLAYPSLRSSLNSRPFHLLRTLFTLSLEGFVAKRANSFGIRQIQTLFAKHPGWGEDPTLPRRAFPSAVICATWRLYPLCPPSIALTSRHHGIPQQPFLGASVSLRQSNLCALCFHILTNCVSHKPFVFTTIRIALGCGGAK